MPDAEFLPLKHIKTLLTKKGRKQHKLYLAEGVRLLEEAVRLGARPIEVLQAPSALSDRGRSLVKAFERLHVPIREITARQIHSLSSARTSQGLLAINVIPQRSFTGVCQEYAGDVFLCDNISDPGNLGTLLRSAAAFGFGCVGLVGRCAEVFAPKVVRSTAGAIFALRVAVTDTAEIAALANAGRFQVLAADSDGDVQLTNLDSSLTSGRIALAVGSEYDGLSVELKRTSRATIRIQQEDGVESLNAAVAGSICMHYIAQQRRQ